MRCSNSLSSSITNAMSACDNIVDKGTRRDMETLLTSGTECRRCGSAVRLRRGASAVVSPAGIGVHPGRITAAHALCRGVRRHGSWCRPLSNLLCSVRWMCSAACLCESNPLRCKSLRGVCALEPCVYVHRVKSELMGERLLRLRRRAPLELRGRRRSARDRSVPPPMLNERARLCPAG